MKLKNNYLFWIPRILGILLVIFWFAFIILSHGISITTAVESVIWITILITLLMAWSWEGIGGILFLIWGFIYFVLVFIRMPLSLTLLISGPLFLEGVLFILDHYINK